MKRFAVIFAIVCLAAVFSGCLALPGITQSKAPSATEAATPTAAAAPTIAATPPTASPTLAATATPAPAAAAPEYFSKALGIAFDLPEGWVGKCRVEEGDGYLTMYFNPSEPIDPGEGDGEMFCIVKKTPGIEASMYDNSKEIDIGGVAFIWGEPTDVRYQPDQPEYGTYTAMLKDLPQILASLHPLTGLETKNIIPVKTITAPQTNVYTSDRLGIGFTVPQSWVGKYRVEETEGYISVYFVPKEPVTEDTGDGWLFCIETETPDTANDMQALGGAKEVTVGGVTYICGGPTDVSYIGPEEDTFMAMTADVPGVYDTIRAD